jgi:hypothetical protein
MEFSIEYLQLYAQVTLVVPDLSWAVSHDLVCGGSVSSLFIA